ncbi:MAG: tetratricopeptide repeat protein [Gammaproteobacteria bacterium]|nr:tetratricopeptide repeat protein [Gammaproteobacteria bacterium]
MPALHESYASKYIKPEFHTLYSFILHDEAEKLVAELTQKNINELIGISDWKGVTLLGVAILGGKLDIVKKLLAIEGIDIELAFEGTGSALGQALSWYLSSYTNDSEKSIYKRIILEILTKNPSLTHNSVINILQKAPKDDPVIILIEKIIAFQQCDKNNVIKKSELASNIGILSWKLEDKDRGREWFKIASNCTLEISNSDSFNEINYPQNKINSNANISDEDSLDECSSDESLSDEYSSDEDSSDELSAYTRELTIEEEKKSIENLNEAIKLNPKNVINFMDLGDIYFRTNKFENALVTYKKAIELNPKSQLIYMCLASFYTKLNKFDDAIETYNKILELNCDFSFSAYKALGFVYSMKYQFKDSANAYKKAIELVPEDITNYAFLAMSHEEQNNFKDAIDAYKEGIENWITNPYIECYESIIPLIVNGLASSEKKMGKCIDEALVLKVLSNINDNALRTTLHDELEKIVKKPFLKNLLPQAAKNYELITTQKEKKAQQKILIQQDQKVQSENSQEFGKNENRYKLANNNYLPAVYELMNYYLSRTVQIVGSERRKLYLCTKVLLLSTHPEMTKKRFGDMTENKLQSYITEATDYLKSQSIKPGFKYAKFAEWCLNLVNEQKSQNYMLLNPDAFLIKRAYLDEFKSDVEHAMHEVNNSYFSTKYLKSNSAKLLNEKLQENTKVQYIDEPLMDHAAILKKLKDNMEQEKQVMVSPSASSMPASAQPSAFSFIHDEPEQQSNLLSAACSSSSAKVTQDLGLMSSPYLQIGKEDVEVNTTKNIPTADILNLEFFSSKERAEALKDSPAVSTTIPVLNTIKNTKPKTELEKLGMLVAAANYGDALPYQVVKPVLAEAASSSSGLFSHTRKNATHTVKTTPNKNKVQLV